MAHLWSFSPWQGRIRKLIFLHQNYAVRDCMSVRIQCKSTNKRAKKITVISKSSKGERARYDDRGSKNEQILNWKTQFRVKGRLPWPFLDRQFNQSVKVSLSYFMQEIMKWRWNALRVTFTPLSYLTNWISYDRYRYRFHFRSKFDIHKSAEKWNANVVKTSTFFSVQLHTSISSRPNL